MSDPSPLSPPEARLVSLMCDRCFTLHYHGLRITDGIAMQPHPCPYKQARYDDSITHCECCADCTHQCAMDV
jgi:hypothetical protein